LTVISYFAYTMSGTLRQRQLQSRVWSNRKFISPQASRLITSGHTAPRC